MKEEKQAVRSSFVKAALVVALGLLVGVGCNLTRTALEVPKAVVPDFDTASNYQVKKGAQAAEYTSSSTVGCASTATTVSSRSPRWDGR